jgi:hypothetical protein
MGFFCCLRFKEKRPDANRIGRCAPLSLLIQARKRRWIRSNRPQNACHKLPGINQAFPETIG